MDDHQIVDEDSQMSALYVMGYTEWC